MDIVAENPPVRILIVADDPLAAGELETALKKLGHDVVGLEGSVEQGIACGPQASPDLVVLDIGLQGPLDAFEAAEIIRSRLGRPCLLLASEADWERPERTHPATPGRTLLKPFRNRDLQTAVETALYIFRMEAARKKAEETLRAGEEKFTKVFLTSPDPIAISRLADGVYLEINDGFVQVSGYSREELIGRSPLPGDLGLWVRREDRDRVVAALQESGEIQGFEFLFRCKNGSIRNGLFSARVIEINGEHCLVAVIRDLTEWKKAEEALRQSREDLLRAQEVGQMGNWRLDLHRNVLTWSDETYRIFGLPKDFPLTYETFLELVPPEDRPYVDNRWQASLGGEPYDLEHRIVAQGEMKWVREKAYLEFDGQGQPAGGFGITQDITERKRIEEALRRNEAQLSNALRIGRLGYWEYDAAENLFTFNDQFYSIFRTTAEQVGGYKMTPERYAGLFVHPDDRPLVAEEVRQALDNGDPEYSRQLEHRIIYADGEPGYISVRFFAVKDPGGRTIKTYGANQDITEQKRAAEEREQLQRQLNQAQKMESIGRLAGGVAHDFNNMLSVILANADLALEEPDQAGTLRKNLIQIRQAAQRSADLTRQLLAFARRQTVAPKVLDLNETVESMLKMIRRLIGEDIDLTWQPARSLGPVCLDPSQVDQILANLCVNGREAIANVGRITIETGQAFLDASYCKDHPGSSPGEFVRLTVSDDGCGIDPVTVGRIFEPFFTTKEVGQGTGLGLATVYGIVKQNNGFIDVRSQPGTGTTFEIYLPRHAEKAGLAESAPTAAMPRGRGETVLLVEDDAMLLATTGTLLEKLGYTVLAADGPAAAVAFAKEYQGGFDLLLTDLIMPELNGRELSDQIKKIRPRIKCLFMSGYPADVISRHHFLDEGFHFIEKPFTVDNLAVKISEILGRTS